LSASAVMIHYEEMLYQVYAPLPLAEDVGRPKILVRFKSRQGKC